MPFTNFPYGVTSFGVPLTGSLFSSPFGGQVWFVDTVNGSNGQDGQSPDTAFATMAAALAVVGSLDTIFFVGHIKEQLVAPLGVYGVTIVGASTRTRYDDLGSAWGPPASPVALTPLIEIRQQGWVFINTLFDAPSDAACIKAHRNEDATYPDSSHFQVLNCQFSDGATGIEDAGGNYNYLVDGCRFRRLTNALKCTSTAISVPLQDTVQNCIFQDNTNDILSSYVEATLQNNIHNNTTTQKINTIYNAAQGARNMVIGNYVSSALANINPAGGFTGSATDIWRTFCKDQAASVVVSPPT